MRVRLSEIRLRPTGKKVRLDRDVEVESLFVGRGPDNDLLLKGLTISLHQATIRRGDGRFFIEAAPAAEVNVNGLVSQGERIGVGDRIKLGTWELRVLDPEAGFDLAIEYEEIDRPQSERAALDLRTRIGLPTGPIAMRPLVWLGIVGVLLLFGVIPLAWAPLQASWNTGPVSRGHAYIENACANCHTGYFETVQNEACTTCHHDIGRHAPPEVSLSGLDDAACADCHLEHRGREVDLADLGSGFCSDCHADLSARRPETRLRDASDFGDDHPPFRLALVTDAEVAAVSVDRTPDLVEVSGLTFDHLRHVGQAVSGRGDEKQYLRCGACHQPDAGGHYMQPIVFEEHCEDCHRLDFDAAAPPDLVPHGDPARIRERIRDYYSSRILAEDGRDASVPRRLRVRRPGAALSSEEAELSRSWVEQKLAAAEVRFFDRPGTCALCHTLEPGAARDGGMGVAAVRLQTVWVPGSIFSHDSHAPFACAECHPAAAVFDPDDESGIPRPDWSVDGSIPYALIERGRDTVVSESPGDILIPELETCRACHAGAEVSGGEQVPSPCSMCHAFHVREHGPWKRASERSDPARAAISAAPHHEFTKMN